MTCRCGKEFCYSCGKNYPNCPCSNRLTHAPARAGQAARGRGIARDRGRDQGRGRGPVRITSLRSALTS
jgi:hypothetical protein